MYTPILMSLSLEELMFDLSEWPNPASGLVEGETYTEET